MDESIKCECGQHKLWWHGAYLRCPECLNQLKMTTIGGHEEYWMRRYNHTTYTYGNWEHLNAQSFSL